MDSLGSVGLALIIARRLGPEALGAYAYGLTPAAIFSAAAAVPMTQIVVREIARRPRRVRRYVSDAMLLRALIVLPAGVVVSAAIAGLLPMSYETREVMVLLGLAAGFGSISDLVFGAFQATARFGPPVVATAVFKVATLIATWFVAQQDGGIVHVAVLLVWLQLGQALLGIALLYVFVTPIDWAVRPSAWRRLLRESAPLAATGLSDSLSSRLDALMIAVMRPLHEVGIYVAAYNVFISATVVIGAVQTAALPTLARLEESRFRHVWRRVLLASLALGLLMALVLTGVPQLVLGVLYGPRLGAAETPLRIIGVVVVIYAMRRAVMTGMIVRNEQRLIVVAVLCGGLLNVALNLVLIPAYGPNGAAAAKLAADVCALAVAGVLFRRHIAGPAPDEPAPSPEGWARATPREAHQ